MKTLTPLLNVSDCERSVRFYQEHLGFAVESSYEEQAVIRWARLANGGVSIMVNTPDRLLGSEVNAGEAVLYLSVEDVRALHRTLLTAGLSPSPVRAELYGLDEFYLKDPDGYQLAFTSPAST